MSRHVNPFAAPAVAVEEPEDLALGATAEAERIRREHIDHEASVKAIGSLWLLGAVLIVPVGLVLVRYSLMVDESGLAPVLSLGYTGLGLFSGWTGWQIRKLERKGRVPGMVLAAFGLIGFPIGTLISAYILYLLGSGRGQTVLSPEYQEVVRLTPHVKRKTSQIVMALFVIFLLALGGAFLISFVS